MPLKPLGAALKAYTVGKEAVRQGERRLNAQTLDWRRDPDPKRRPKRPKRSIKEIRESLWRMLTAEPELPPGDAAM